MNSDSITAKNIASMKTVAGGKGVTLSTEYYEILRKSVAYCEAVGDFENAEKLRELSEWLHLN